jgi:large subunit ribosomal protein L1
MPRKGKRYSKAVESFDMQKPHGLEGAIAVLKGFPDAKFDETVEMAMHLGIDPRQADQMVRGTLTLPHGSGREVKVLVFATGQQADAAQEAGAEHVGYEEYVEKIQKEGWVDFDVAIATPETMKEVRKLGRVLGPRGLMPNPKVGTVTDDVATAVKEVKAGKVEYRNDRTANVHVPIGKKSFTAEQLLDNAVAVFDAISKAKPTAAKGTYIQSVTICSTMSPGIELDIRELSKG